MMPNKQRFTETKLPGSRDRVFGLGLRRHVAVYLDSGSAWRSPIRKVRPEFLPCGMELSCKESSLG